MLVAEQVTSGEAVEDRVNDKRPSDGKVVEILFAVVDNVGVLRFDRFGEEEYEGM